MEIESHRTRFGTILATLFAMLAFAANSILCRLALGQELIDAASFATVRVISGAATLGGVWIVLAQRAVHVSRSMDLA